MSVWRWGLSKISRHGPYPAKSPNTTSAFIKTVEADMSNTVWEDLSPSPIREWKMPIKILFNHTSQRLRPSFPDTVDDRNPAGVYIQKADQNLRDYGSVVYFGSCRIYIINSSLVSHDPTNMIKTKDSERTQLPSIRLHSLVSSACTHGGAFFT